MNAVTTYGPIDYCIYCGRSDGPLADEHILAYGLGGIHVLREASCRSCAKITAAFEQICLRRMFGAYRIRHNAPTRRRKERPKKIETSGFQLDSNGREFTLSMPMAHVPATVMLPELKPPRLLTGKPEPGYRLNIYSTFNEGFLSHSRPNQALLAGHFEFGPFLRLLAKTAHAMSFAHTPRANGNCVRLLPDTIIRNADPFWYVGGGNFDFTEPNRSRPLVHQVGFSSKEANGCLYATIYIRLFASIPHAPTYEILVAEVPR